MGLIKPPADGLFPNKLHSKYFMESSMSSGRPPRYGAGIKGV